MRDELDQKLCEKYPKIFANRHGDMRTTAMCWGFECGDGWYQIIDSLCLNIQSHIDWQNENFAKGYTQYKQVPQVVATQVKEKFGGLRFYYEGGDDVIDGMVRMAESWAINSCEECGVPGTQNSQGWIKTLCEIHRQERETRYTNHE